MITTAGPARSQSFENIPNAILLRITRAEDERRWDKDLSSLFTDRSNSIRSRAALAAGRIGNEAAIPPLANLLKTDPENAVKAMAAFAIGEIEAAAGADVLLEVVRDTAASMTVRSRAIEGLGKIAAALPKEQESRQREIGAAILDALKSQSGATDRDAAVLGLTAVLRSRPKGAGSIVAGFLQSSDARVRADAANVLARLRSKEGNELLRTALKSEADPVARANAARVLGATDDKPSLEALLESATRDQDSRVRVSAIRSIAALKTPSAARPLLTYGESLTRTDLKDRPAEVNEVLEIATALGRLIPASENQSALNWLRIVRNGLQNTAPEAEIAYARIWPAAYLAEFGEGEIAVKNLQRTFILNWRSGAAIASGLGEIATIPNTVKKADELKHWAKELLAGMVNYRNSGIKINSLLPLHTEYGIPEVLRAYAAYKPKDLKDVLLENLKDSDVIVRSTAADLLGDLPPSEANTAALVSALGRARNDKVNDAVLSTLDSLAKQKTAAANQTIKASLNSSDYLVRRRAANLLKENKAGDFSARVGRVRSRNTVADYQRALSRIGKPVQAVVTTTKGSFTMDLFPTEAPLTVDNFVQLAQRSYFNGVTIHRVVPNFVIQDGDPRGDGTGGPGYEIRCEINQRFFERASVGMALSGKDTGGSQWFVTHSPQPHLDGGYTVFGEVSSGMDVVDKIVRGDVIKSVQVNLKTTRR